MCEMFLISARQDEKTEKEINEKVRKDSHYNCAKLNALESPS